MIFTAFCTICWLLIDFLLFILPSIPMFPSNFESNVISGIKLLIDNGLCIIKLFVDYPVIYSCLGVVAIVYGLIFTYSIILFIIRKLPFINIS